MWLKFIVTICVLVILCLLLFKYRNNLLKLITYSALGLSSANDVGQDVVYGKFDKVTTYQYNRVKNNTQSVTLKWFVKYLNSQTQQPGDTVFIILPAGFFLYKSIDFQIQVLQNLGDLYIISYPTLLNCDIKEIYESTLSIINHLVVNVLNTPVYLVGISAGGYLLNMILQADSLKSTNLVTNFVKGVIMISPYISDSCISDYVIKILDKLYLKSKTLDPLSKSYNVNNVKQLVMLGNQDPWFTKLFTCITSNPNAKLNAVIKNYNGSHNFYQTADPSLINIIRQDIVNFISQT